MSELEKLLRTFMGEEGETAALVAGEAQLRLALEFNQKVIAAVDEGIVVLDRELRYRLWNRFMERLSGLPREAVLGRNVQDLFPGLMEQGLQERLQRALAGEAVAVPDMMVAAPDGQIWTSGRLVPLRDEQGATIGVLGSVSDITDRKRTEEVLRASEGRYRTLAEAVSDAIAVSREGLLVDVNHGFERMFGWSREEALGRSVLFFVEPGWRDVVASRVQSASEDPYEFVGVTRSGERLELRSVSRVFSNGHPLRMTALRDVTLQRRYERQLRLQAEALEAAANAIVITDREGTIEWVNRAWERLSGYPAGEAIGRRPNILKSGLHDRPYFEQMWRTILSGEVWNGELTNLRRDGAICVVETTIAPIRDEQGTVVRFIGIQQDVTERRREQEELRESQERLRLALATGNVGLWETDLRTTKVRYSGDWRKQLGVEAGDFSEDIAQFRSRVHEEDVDRVMDELWSPGPGVSEREFEFRLRHRDGSFRHLLARATTVRGADARPVRVIGSCIDLNDHMRLQTELLQAQKMEGIGLLAGGIAHDFNNILTAIIGTAELALRDLPEGAPFHEEFGDIHREAVRAAGLTRQLLAFSRRQVLRPELLDLNRVVASMRALLRRLIAENINVISVAAAKGRVYADPSQIEQVVMNLAVNARDAMPDGGDLVIETRDVVLDAESASVHPSLASGRYVMLSVSDTGVGMDEATRARVFEPFFTTKGLGRGTGLGLSTVYGLVKQSGGGIWVYSEPGAGTTFKIYFPAVSPDPEDRNPVEPDELPPGTETVLVVEDDPAARSVAARVLSRLGYRVIEAANALQAMRKLEDRDTGIQLVLADLVMPGMGGRELAGFVRSRYSGVKVLLASGYTDDTALRNGVMEDAKYFLAKPYSSAELARKVREVLDSG